MSITDDLSALKSLLKTGLNFVRDEWELTSEREIGEEEREKLIVLYATNKKSGQKYSLVLTLDRRDEQQTPG